MPLKLSHLKAGRQRGEIGKKWRSRVLIARFGAIFCQQNDAVLTIRPSPGTIIVRSQPSLRPFDIAVALRLLLVPEERYEPLAAALVTSTSAVHRSVARLQLAGLCVPSRRTIVGPALREFLAHGVRFAFPPVIGPERAGMATAWGHPDAANWVGATSVPPRPMVWPSEQGTSRGETLVPLFRNVIAVAAADDRLYQLLAMVDMCRVGDDSIRSAVVESMDLVVGGALGGS